MTKYEYQHVTTNEYLEYAKKANNLLSAISYSQKIGLKDINFQNIIEFFQSKFNIHFVFFDVDPTQKDEHATPQSDSSWIKYKDVLSEASFQFLPMDIVTRISGITIPKGKRTLIMINQNRVLQRVIFTILHELCHFYFHILDGKKRQVFVSLNNDQIEGQYSQELLPFENEANNIASILFCPTKRLEYMLIKKYSFKDMCRHTGMSEPAMHNRLLNYFEHILLLPNHLALSYVVKLRKQNISIYHSIIYKINAKINEEKILIEKATIIALQNAYVDKYGCVPFWQDIFAELGLTSENKTDKD
ncbi:ImmA/IrrE family metallo-endopeptidase [Enterococcus gallinarum]|uniref:ImmA/IrrE family metallo-endopeptidase n=1 Tax=Enterococcus gallinarum TaxID=1353 RepID=UPI001F57345B|nr:ImmA/IrrE family metallo-endopeptidase [Enterococcus gallinarum]